MAQEKDKTVIPEGREQPSTTREIPPPSPREEVELLRQAAERGERRVPLWEAIDGAVKEILADEMRKSGVIHDREPVELSIAGQNVTITKEEDKVKITVPGKNEVETQRFVMESSIMIQEAFRRELEERRKVREAQARMAHERQAEKERSRVEYEEEKRRESTEAKREVSEDVYRSSYDSSREGTKSREDGGDLSL